MEPFNTQQLNALITGTELAVEITPSRPSRRAFVIIGSYETNGSGKAPHANNYINSEIKNKTFWIKKYEIDEGYIRNKWDVTLDDVANYVFIKDIQDLQGLYLHIAQFGIDISRLEPSWKVENPI